jgi:hypothetical protein
MKKIAFTICLLILLAGYKNNQQQASQKEKTEKDNIIANNINTKNEIINFLKYYLAENFRLNMVYHKIIISKSERALYIDSEEKENFTIFHFKFKNAFGKYVDEYVTFTKSGLFFNKPKTLKEISSELNSHDNLINTDAKIELIRQYLQKIDTFGNRNITVSYVNSIEESDYFVLNFVIRNNRFNRFKDEPERFSSSDAIDFKLFTDRQIYVSKDLNYIFSTLGGPKSIETLKLQIKEKKLCLTHQILSVALMLEHSFALTAATGDIVKKLSDVN